MEFCFISPLKYTKLMSLGDIIFVLAHLYKDHSSYRNDIIEYKQMGYRLLVDNGAAEGNLIDDLSLIDIYKELTPFEIILPDVLFDKELTLRKSENMINKLSPLDLDIENVMGVPQGNIQEEWVECYREMINNVHIDTIGFSKGSVSKCFNQSKDDQGIMEARHKCFDYLKENGLLKKPIHLLGAGDPREFQYYNNHPMVRSNDTCNWIWSGMNNIVYSEGNFERVKTPKDYFEKEMGVSDVINATRNIDWIINIYKNGK